MLINIHLQGDWEKKKKSGKSIYVEFTWHESVSKKRIKTLIFDKKNKKKLHSKKLCEARWRMNAELEHNYDEQFANIEKSEIWIFCFLKAFKTICWKVMMWEWKSQRTRINYQCMKHLKAKKHRPLSASRSKIRAFSYLLKQLPLAALGWSDADDLLLATAYAKDSAPSKTQTHSLQLSAGPGKRIKTLWWIQESSTVEHRTLILRYQLLQQHWRITEHIAIMSIWTYLLYNINVFT